MLIQLLTAARWYALIMCREFCFLQKSCEIVFVQLLPTCAKNTSKPFRKIAYRKARWVRVRGTYSFFAAIGLDRAFAFVSFFIKAWKSVN